MLSAPHGVKRRGDESVDTEQPLSKRLNLLNLEENGGKLWVPVAAVEPNLAAPAPGNRSKVQQSFHRPESMQVDDTKDKIYIHNLDEEIANIEAEDGKEQLVFLPDIEAKLGKIPKHLLKGQQPSTQVQGNEMVLYSVPSSLSIPVEHDSVRKAIIESRARSRAAQEQQQQRRRQQQGVQDSSLPNGTHDGRKIPTNIAHLSMPRLQEDEDAMDIG